MSPFTAAEVQQAAVAALLSDTGVEQSQGNGGSSSIQPARQKQATARTTPLPASSSNNSRSSSDASSVASASSTMRRSQSSQALMTIGRHSFPLSSAADGIGCIGQAAAAVGIEDSEGLVRSIPSRAGSGSTSSAAGDLRRPKDQDCSAAMAQQQQQQQPPSGASGRVMQGRTEPYDLRVVAHSLGGMSMLVYLVMRCAAGQPHHVRRLILMSPAGFHHVVPAPFWPFILVLPWWHRLLVLLLGRHRACECWQGGGDWGAALVEFAAAPCVVACACAEHSFSLPLSPSPPLAHEHSL